MPKSWHRSPERLLFSPIWHSAVALCWAAPRRIRGPYTMIQIVTLLVAIGCLVCGLSPAPAVEPLKLLFLGDNGHHQPKARFDEVQPVLKARGIELTYSDK